MLTEYVGRDVRAFEVGERVRDRYFDGWFGTVVSCESLSRRAVVRWDREGSPLGMLRPDAVRDARCLRYL